MKLKYFAGVVVGVRRIFSLSERFGKFLAVHAKWFVQNQFPCRINITEISIEQRKNHCTIAYDKINSSVVSFVRSFAFFFRSLAGSFFHTLVQHAFIPEPNISGTTQRATLANLRTKGIYAHLIRKSGSNNSFDGILKQNECGESIHFPLGFQFPPHNSRGLCINKFLRVKHSETKVFKWRSLT